MRFIAGNKTLVVNIDISFVINNPIFTDDNSFAFPFSMLKNDETNDFFSYIGEISNSNTSYRKIDVIMLHDVFSIAGVLDMNEAGDEYNMHFVASDFWDKAKNNRLAELMSGYSHTFTAKQELKDTWNGGHDFIFAPLYNHKFTEEWPVGFRANQLLNDPDSFDDNNNTLFVPFMRLDSLIRKAVEKCGARITVNELETLSDYHKILVYNNYAINTLEVSFETPSKKTIPIVYMHVNHPTTGNAEIMLPVTAPALSSKFYLSQLEDPESAIENSTSEKTVAEKVTPDSIMRFPHTNSSYGSPALRGFVEINTRKAVTSFGSTNPLLVGSTGHGLTTGEKIHIIAPNNLLIHDQTYEITRVGANHFTIPVDGTLHGSEEKIFFSSIDASGAPLIIFKTSEESWPSHLKVKHNLAITDKVYINSPVFGLALYYDIVEIIDDYTFSIATSVTSYPGEQKGYCHKVNFWPYHSANYFAQRRCVHIIKTIKPTNPCEVVFRDEHYLANNSILRFRNTGNSVLDNNTFIAENNGDDGVKLKEVDGTGFTEFSAGLVSAANNHLNLTSADNHTLAPDIAYAELLQVENGVNLTIDYSNHVPEITLSEFIKNIENKLACRFVYNIFNNEIKIRLLGKALENRSVEDVTGISGKGLIILPDPIDGFKITNPAPDNDTYYTTIALSLDYGSLSFKERVLLEEQLPLTGNSINDVRMVSADSMLWIWQKSFTGEEKWKKLAPNIIDVLSGGEEYNPSSLLSTFMHYNGHCRTDQQGRCISVAPWIEQKPSLSLFMFNYPESANPHTTNGFENSNNELVLFASGSNGLYLKLWYKYIEWYLNVRKPAKKIIQWDNKHLTGFDESAKIRINHHDYFIQSIELIFKKDNTVEWGYSNLLKT